MKIVLLILLTVFVSTNTFSQDVIAGLPVELAKDTAKYFYFNKSQVLSLSNGIRTLEAKVSIQDTLIGLYRLQLRDFQSAMQLNDSIISNQQKQIYLYQVNELNYKQLADLSKPSFWNSPVLWGILGGLTGLSIGFVFGLGAGSLR
jgi:hypothetical protein